MGFGWGYDPCSKVMAAMDRTFCFAEVCAATATIPSGRPSRYEAFYAAVAVFHPANRQIKNAIAQLFGHYQQLGVKKPTRTLDQG